MSTLTHAGLNHLRPIGEGAACLRAARALLASEEHGEEEQGEEMVEDHALLASEEQGEEHEGEEQREEQGEVELRLRMGGRHARGLTLHPRKFSQVGIGTTRVP